MLNFKKGRKKKEKKKKKEEMNGIKNCLKKKVLIKEKKMGGVMGIYNSCILSCL